MTTTITTEKPACFYGMPRGVTVRTSAIEQAPARKPSLLETAANNADRDAAIRLVAEALQIGVPNSREYLNVSDAWRWSRLSPCSRLSELAEWLRAEAFEAMDLIEMPAISTIGD